MKITTTNMEGWCYCFNLLLFNEQYNYCLQM